MRITRTLCSRPIAFWLTDHGCNWRVRLGPGIYRLYIWLMNSRQAGLAGVYVALGIVGLVAGVGLVYQAIRFRMERTGTLAAHQRADCPRTPLIAAASRCAASLRAGRSVRWRLPCESLRGPISGGSRRPCARRFLTSGPGRTDPPALESGTACGKMGALSARDALV
jgi:hypothetical protein